MKKLLIAAGLALAAVSAVAVAQVPGVYITSPTGKEQINVLNPGPYIATINLRQARDAAGYLTISQAATQTLTVGDNTSVLAFYGATAGTATITTPAHPCDGQRLQIFSTAGITTLTLTANTGQTVNNGATVIAANGNVEYIYQLSNLTWYRIQ